MFGQHNSELQVQESTFQSEQLKFTWLAQDTRSPSFEKP